jgi:hypothetical protein
MEYTIPDLSINDVVIGVKVIDKDGNQSMVSAYDLSLPTPARQDGGAPASRSAAGRPGGQ